MNEPALAAIRASVCARVVVASWSVSAPSSLSAAIAIVRQPPALLVGHVGAVEHEHPVERRRRSGVRHADPAEQLRSPGGGANPKRDSFVAGPSSDSAAAIDWSTSSQGCRCSRRRETCLPRSELLGVGGGADGEQLPELLGLRLQALVGRRPALQRPERLDAGVRLPEHAEAEDADDDEQGGDQRRTRRAASSAPRSGCARRARARGRLPSTAAGDERPASHGAVGPASGPSVAGAADEVVISHLPSIFCTSWSAATMLTSLPVAVSM